MVADEYDPTDGRNRVLLGTDTKTRAPVYLPYADRDLGVAIIGKAGTGKSSLLEHMILTDLEHGTPGMVIDPHGLLVQRVMQLATPEQADRIILLEATLAVPFGLNMLAIRKTMAGDDPVSWAADIVVATIKKLYGEVDDYLPRLEHYLDLAVRTLIPNSGTLADVPRLFRNDEFRRACLQRVTDPNVLDEWSTFDSLRKTDQVVHIEAVINRLSRMLRAALLQGILGSQETTVPFERILNGDSMLLVSLPSEQLTPERCDFIGALLLSALADRIFTRKAEIGEEKSPRLHIYLDEYQRFATSTTSDLLEQGRKYGAGVTMAHQSLQQIRDPRIRNASRHAGSLIVLGVTRPDAEELAGEFPINPREEWVETIDEVDGTEPIKVLSPTPADDIYLYGHTDSEVDLAARSFFADETWFSKGTGNKSSGVHPRPGGIDIDEHVKVPIIVVRDFLSQAMAGALSTNELFCDALIGDTSRDYHGHPVFFHFANASPAVREPEPHACRSSSSGLMNIYDPYQIYRGSRLVFRRPLCTCNRSNRLTLAADEAHNEAVDRLFRESCRPQAERIRTWVMTYLEDRDALRAGESTRAFSAADNLLDQQSDMDYWDVLWNWVNPLQKLPTGELEPAERPSNVQLTRSILTGPSRILSHEDWKAIYDQQKARNEAIDIMRQRLRWLVILADGLQRSPIFVPSGEQQPRKVTRHIVHSGQTYADALNEVAGRLVHPSKRYVAHVRQPQQYHQVKLRPPLEGESYSAAVDLVRERSQRLYMRRERLAEDPPPIVDTNLPSPPVTRRPPEPPDQPPQDEPTD